MADALGKDPEDLVSARLNAIRSTHVTSLNQIAAEFCMAHSPHLFALLCKAVHRKAHACMCLVAAVHSGHTIHSLHATSSKI